MKKLKSSILNMVLVLTTISIIAGVALAAINKYTEKKIAEINSEKLAQSIKDVLNIPASEHLIVNDKVEGDFIFHKTAKGIAVESTQNGFGGKLKILVGFDNNGTILGYSILETQETPGLGAKANEWFQKNGKGCIVGKNPSTTRMGVTKGDEGDIDAITASTITSRAFLRAVQAAYNTLFWNETDGITSATNENKANITKEQTIIKNNNNTKNVKTDAMTSATSMSSEPKSTQQSKEKPNKTEEITTKASTESSTRVNNEEHAETDATTSATATE